VPGGGSGRSRHHWGARSTGSTIEDKDQLISNGHYWFIYTHGSPPGTSCPPGNTYPYMLVIRHPINVKRSGRLTDPDTGLLHGAQGSLDCGDTGSVGSSTNFSEEALEIVGLKPCSCCSQTLGADGRRHACAGSSRTVRIEVLMHFYRPR
jgi:hypothetical protein